MCLTCLSAFNCVGYVLEPKFCLLPLLVAWCLLQSERSTIFLGNKLFTAGHVIPRLVQLRSKCRSFSEPVKLNMGWDSLETLAMWAWRRLKLFKIGMNKCDVGMTQTFAWDIQMSGCSTVGTTFQFECKIHLSGTLGFCLIGRKRRILFCLAFLVPDLGV